MTEEESHPKGPWKTIYREKSITLFGKNIVYFRKWYKVNL